MTGDQVNESEEAIVNRDDLRGRSNYFPAIWANKRVIVRCISIASMYNQSRSALFVDYLKRHGLLEFALQRTEKFISFPAGCNPD